MTGLAPGARHPAIGYLPCHALAARSSSAAGEHLQTTVSLEGRGAAAVGAGFDGVDDHLEVEEVAAAGVAARVDVTLGERQGRPDEQPAEAGDRHLVEQKPETEAQVG
jgi:hypothetical protein